MLEFSEKIEKREWTGSMYQGPVHLQHVITDIRFARLKKEEQRTINAVEKVLPEYFDSQTAAARVLRKLWKVSLQLLSDREIDPFVGNEWSYFVGVNSPKAENRIQDMKLNQKMENILIEQYYAISKNFEDAPEYKNYMKVREEALSKVKTLKESLMKWADRMFSLTSH